MDHLWLLIFISLIISTSGFHCPDVKGCSTCQIALDGSYEFRCPAVRNSTFTMKYAPNKFIYIECDHSANWSDFRVSDLMHTKDAKKFFLGSCSLPENKSLVEVTQQLGMTNVEELIIQSMLLNSTLNAKYLMGFSSVSRLILSSLGLENVDKDLLQGVPNLKTLDLRDNHVNISKNFFDHVPKLELLELGQNSITYIEPDTFRSLQKLKLLNLWQNKIQKIDSGTFDNLISLEALDLHSNFLQEIAPDAFANLLNLHVINLSDNNFTSLPADLFKYNTHLRTISFFTNAKNLTTLSSGLFSNLTELKNLKLGRIGLLHLPENLFSGAVNLEQIELDRNYLTTLPQNIFQGLKKLRKLTMSFNDFHYLPEGLFDETSNLIHLDLSINHITVISGQMLSGLTSLQELNMERNGLKGIHWDAFHHLSNLETAKFAYNKLTLEIDQISGEFGYQSPFRYCISLQNLYLAHNNISMIFQDWTLTLLKLRLLDLKYNNLHNLQTTDLQFISKNLNVDLRYNNISHITLQNVEIMAANQTIQRDVIIELDNNPILCDCFLYTFLKYLEGRMHPYVQNLFHIKPGNLVCQGPGYMKGIIVTQIKSKSLKCLIENDDKQTICPEGCICYHSPEYHSFYINCTFMNLTRAPEKLHTVAPNHVELNLTGNLLMELPSIFQPGYDQVTVLSVSRNNISKVEVENLPSSLEILELHNNNLTNLYPDVLEIMANLPLKKLTLHQNPWQCDCKARDFLNFVQTNLVQVPDLLKITCPNQDRPFADLTVSELCSTTITIIILSVAIALTGITIGVLAALYYRYRSEIKIWLYAHQCCLWLVTEDELDKDKPYDAFISYSHKDEEFVVNELVPKLEEGPRPFKLCLHYRDWLAGDLIPSQIARSVEDSKRTIIVLSPNFLKSVWGAMEFRAAHRQALTEGRARVIMILYGEIPPTENLDAELKAYLNMNTYVQWGDRWFWDKLRYALPHPSEFHKKGASKKIFEKQHPSINLNNDKNCLILTNGNISSPLASTLPTEVADKLFTPNNKQNDKTEKNHKQQNGHVKSGDSNLSKVIIDMNKLQCTTV